MSATRPAVAKPAVAPTTDGRRSRWEGHRALRRRELAGAAIEAVRALGPDVSVQDVARHAGVSKPVVYRHFADKADLHREVGRMAAGMVVEEVTAAMEDADLPVRDRVAAGIDRYLALIEADSALYRFVVRGDPGPARRDGDPVEDATTLAGLAVTRVIAVALRSAGADAGAAEPWGFGIVGMVRAVGDRWLERPSLARPDVVDYLTDLVTPALVAALRR